MKFVCKICKQKSSRIYCCRIKNGKILKFCIRCGNRNGTFGWYNETSFKLNKNLKRQRTCKKCADKKLELARNLRTLKGKRPRKTKNQSNVEFNERQNHYNKNNMTSSYIMILNDPDLDLSEKEKLIKNGEY